MNISEVMPNGNVRVIVPIRLRRTVQGRVITVAENVRTVQGESPLLAAIGCGLLWQQWLDEGLFRNVSELAKHLGKERSFVSHVLQDDILRTYCYSIVDNSGEYLITTWNENADVNGKMASIDVRGMTGLASVEAVEPLPGYIPGYPAFFWFIPDRNIFATIQINTRMNGRKNLENFLFGFLAKHSKYVIYNKEADNIFNILGYVHFLVSFFNNDFYRISISFLASTKFT